MFFIMISLNYFLVLHYGLPYGVAMTFFYSSDVLVCFVCGSLWLCNGFLYLSYGINFVLLII